MRCAKCDHKRYWKVQKEELVQIIQILTYCELLGYKLDNIRYDIYHLPIVFYFAEKKLSLVNVFYYYEKFFVFVFLLCDELWESAASTGIKIKDADPEGCAVEIPYIQTVFLSMKTLICTMLCLLFVVVGWDFNQCWCCIIYK